MPDPAPPPDEDDVPEPWKADGAGAWETWMQARDSAARLIGDLEAENRRLSARIAAALERERVKRVMAREYAKIEADWRAGNARRVWR